ncbi:UNVERIFIED_CONTAM: hypothetical protein PYX00_004061 [Menopon gallinae]|uniref:ZAD domain-containing protein n=1 Tax=Menopon gallinae TaxID=328185 RepID=A0AAW2I4A1_9NEOP
MWSTEADDILGAIQDESEEYLPAIKKQKQKKQGWSEKSMSEALNCCKNQEMGVEEASLIYGVPKRSLRSRLKENNFSLIDDTYRVFLLPTFPLEAELELAEYLHNLIECQFTFTSVEVRRLAYELASEKYNLGDLPREKHCLLGNRWYRTFMSKYPQLETSHEGFFDALETVVRDNHIDADRTFCVDGVELKFRASNAQDLDNVNSKRKVIYTDAKAICCTNASGSFLPPFFINPERNVFDEEKLKKSERLFRSYERLCDDDCCLHPTAEEIANIKYQIKAHLNRKWQPMTEEDEEELRENLYEQFNALRSKILSKCEDSSNAVSKEVFHEWFRGFVAHVKPDCRRRVVLLLGDQSYVKCLKTLEMAKANGVVFLVLPPHASHKIRPLDGFALSLNRNLSTRASVWLGKHPDCRTDQVPLGELFAEAYQCTVNPTIARNGFAYSGIWPVNRNVFESTELGGESVLLRNKSTFGGPNTDDAESGKTDHPNALDVGKMCRVCMKEKLYMKPLFDASGPNYHGRKISEIVGRTISVDDRLPRSICQYCIVQLMDVIKIKNVAVETNKNMIKLRDTLNDFFCEKDDGADTFLLPYRTSKDFDIHSLCRICMGEKPLMTSVFCTFQNSPDLAARISQVCNFQMYEEDGMSSSICPFCRTSVNQAWEFTQKVLSSDERFREILSNIL